MSHVLHETATIVCPHAGQVTVSGANPRVKVSGFGVATLASVYSIAGCTFTTESPKPCATAQWTGPATRVMAGGSPVILSSSSGITIGPLGTQGTPLPVSHQLRVRGQ